MPAFAPVLIPGDLAVADGGEGVDVDVGEDEDEDVVAADGGEGVEADDVVGIRAGEDEGVVAAGTEADHVMAGRSDLWWCLQISGCFYI